jgi:two-component system nitrate/nitrite response regulator NarL
MLPLIPAGVRCWYKSHVPVTVVIADDHPVYRDGIVGAIERAEGLELVETCGDGDAALLAIDAHAPHVAVLDWKMPGKGAVGILDQLAAQGSGTRVLVLSAHVEAESVSAALEAGAGGFVSKEATRDFICQAIRRVAAGETVLDEVAQGAVASHLRANRARARSLLSEREHEVLALLARGLSSQEIADKLILGQSTIKSHTRNLYEKLEVNDRAAAVAEAMRRGLLS